MTRKQLMAYLRNHKACGDAVAWIKGSEHQTLAEAWGACERADWMLWLVAELDVEYSPRLRLSACACARTALRFVPPGEDRPRLAIETAEKYARGEATDNELDAAWDAARAAARDTAGAAAWAAAGAAARDAARDAAWDAAWDAADAAAWDAARDAAGAAAWAAAGAAAWAAALREMADLVRGIIPDPDNRFAREGRKP